MFLEFRVISSEIVRAVNTTALVKPTISATVLSEPDTVVLLGTIGIHIPSELRYISVRSSRFSYAKFALLVFCNR